MYIRTNKDAPRYRVITIDLADVDRAPKELIPEDKEAHLEDVKPVNNDKLAVVFKRNVGCEIICADSLVFLICFGHKVNDEIHIYSKDGSHITRLARYFVGSASISCRHNQDYLFVTMSGFTTPGIVAHCDFAEKEGCRWSVYRTTSVCGLKPQDFEARQVSLQPF